MTTMSKVKPMTCRTLPGMAIVFLVASPVLAQPPEPTAPPSATTGQTTGETRVEELERRLRELAERVLELETSDGNAKAEAPRGEAAAGQAPKAEAPVPESADSSSASQTGPISGYMDFHLNRPEHEDPQLDFHRFVLLFTHSFSDRLRFTGELELEHGFVEGAEESGEVELEQAYLDFKVKQKFNLRRGLLLAPLGMINSERAPRC